MKAQIDLGRQGDYEIWLTKKELESLYDHKPLNGALTFRKDKEDAEHTLSIVLATDEKIREIAKQVPKKGQMIYVGMYRVIVERDNNINHHIISLNEEQVDLREKLNYKNSFSFYELRYDPMLGRKIHFFPLRPGVK